MFTYYSMENTNHGLCLIINNEIYNSNSPRIGSGLDVTNLTNLFSELGFVIILEENLTQSEMKTALEKFASDPRHKKADMAIIICLSHGQLGQLEMVDGKTVILKSKYCVPLTIRLIRKFFAVLYGGPIQDI